MLLEERIRWFCPNDAQKRYIDAVGKKGAYIVIFAAGNGVGKTAATMAMLAAMIWPEIAPSCFASSILSAWPYPKDIRIVGTPQNIADGGSIHREIKAWFPVGRYESIKAGKSHVSEYRANGWTISLMSFDQDISAFESATSGMIIFDEPSPKPIYNACVARMRRGGRILFPNTPLMDAAWVMDDLVAKADGGAIQVVHGDIYENLVENGGILDKTDVDRMLSSYDPDELEARKSGKFMHLSGRILKAFDRSIHVAKENIIPPTSGVDHYMVVDPAIGKPISVIWAYTTSNGELAIYDEHPETEFHGAKDSNLTVSDYVSIFKQRESGRVIANRIIDRHFANKRSTLGGKSLKQEFDEAGLDFVDSYSVSTDAASEVETGILKMKHYLAYNKDKPMDSLNRPRLIISPKCKNTIASLERWSRNAKTGKPNEEYKDFADCVRYLCMANPEIDTPSSWPKGNKPYYAVES